MKISTALTGVTPLLMHNVRLARPDDDYTMAIAAITSKKSGMTIDDRREVARLEFVGGLYIDDDGPFLPAANIRRCFVQAAKVRRMGTKVERALVVLDRQATLEYPGPTKADDLWKDPQFNYTTMVGIQQAKTVRTRPQFPQWRLSLEWELLTDVMNLHDLKETVESAGQVEGLGDNRRNGYGRFTAVVGPA